VGLINCVVILLPEHLIPYNFALSEVNLCPIRTCYSTVLQITICYLVKTTRTKG